MGSCDPSYLFLTCRGSLEPRVCLAFRYVRLPRVLEEPGRGRGCPRIGITQCASICRGFRALGDHLALLERRVSR